MVRSAAPFTVPFALTALLAACYEEAPPIEWTFRDVTASSGIDFRYTFGDDEFSSILEDTGSGLASFDCDGDGALDLYFLSGTWLEGISDPAYRERNEGATNRLYRGRGDGTFEDVTRGSGVEDPGYGMGAAVGDYDQDGDQDLYVLNWGPNALYRNEGACTFSDVTAELDLAGPETLNGQRKWSVNGFFFDYDVDGDLDLYVANYLAFDPDFVDPNLPAEYPYSGPEGYDGQASLLYRNDDGSFVEVTGAAGLRREHGKTMGAACVDLDHDGLLDVVEAVDGAANFLFHNLGDGTFEELGVAAGMAYDADGNSPPSMHPTIGDYDLDGRPDIFMPDLAFGCLYHNRGELRFAEKRLALGLGRDVVASGWGSAFEDLDNDADPDLLIVFGGAFSAGAGERDRLFLSDGAGGFGDGNVFLGGYFQSENTGRGIAVGDFDGDGDLDFVINSKDLDGAPNLVLNDLPPGNHWLAIELEGSASNRDGIGARVELTAGGATQVRQLLRCGAYLSSDPARLHFGLGEADEVEGLTVRWPSGQVQEVELPATVDAVLVVREPRD